MSALPPDQLHAMRKTAREATRPVETLARRWDEIHAKAAELSALAQLAQENPVADGAALAKMLREASEWRRNLAWQQIEDIDAIMQPGITALRTITARGGDVLAPAQALWREFHAAREGVLGMIGKNQKETA
ncbi:hypothetical protein [Erythrobacter sp. THAF29]|uniref:hypothetical protein n=1 Tax=Erythrobacter sp. THAF29 TaxID=2587851 RepID=UPI0012678BCB|nr:hypothetical protein [Erythrobacter sp. THAF29]QFT76455.1 hypothetical protein FIU90_02750 [Erythrobacter sp. THAF29]